MSFLQDPFSAKQIIGIDQGISNFFKDPLNSILNPIVDPIINQSGKLTKSVAQNFSNLIGVDGPGLKGISKEMGGIMTGNIRELFDSTINNTNPMFYAVAGIASLGFLLLIWKIPKI